MIVLAIFSAVTNALGVVVDKVNLSRLKMSLKPFIVVLFFGLFLFTAIVEPYLGGVSYWEALQPYYFLMFIGMLIMAIIWNVFYYQGIQKEQIQEFELIIMATPLATITLAAIFFSDERQLHHLIAAVIAALAILIAHLRKDHLHFSKASLGLIVAVLFMAAETLFQKVLLNIYQPASLYLVRTFIIFLIFLLLYRPSLKNINSKQYLLTFLSALFGAAYMISKFYGFQNLGIVETTLILTLAPILVYFISAYYLKENLKKRTLLAAAVILASIIYSQVG